MPGSELQHKLFAQNLVEAARAGQVLQKGSEGAGRVVVVNIYMAQDRFPLEFAT